MNSPQCCWLIEEEPYDRQCPNESVRLVVTEAVREDASPKFILPLCERHSGALVGWLVQRSELGDI